jgi:hypothetical protein
MDVWFDADLPRVFDNMVSRTSDNKRSEIHPFFSLLTFPCIYVLKGMTGLGDWTVTRLLIAMGAAASIAFFYALLRCIGLALTSAVVFSLLAAMSATGMFWFIVPETMPFATATILAGLVFVAVAASRPVSPFWSVALNLLTMGITITNWLIGLLATIASYTRQQVIRIVAITVCVAIGLSALHAYCFPRMGTLGVARAVAEEQLFAFRKDAGHPIDSARAFVFHSMVMPKVEQLDHYWYWSKWPILRVQFSSIGSGTAWGPIAALLWCALLGLGVWSLLTAPASTPVRWVLLSFLVFQGAMHSIYGRETFLYSPHFGPLLVALAAYGMLSRWRHVCLVLTCALLATVTINNGTILRETLASVDASRPPSVPLGTTIDFAALHQKTTPTPEASVVLSDDRGTVAAAVGLGGSLAVGENGPRVAIWVAHENSVFLTSDVYWSPGTLQRVRPAWTGKPLVATNSWLWASSPVVETYNWYYRVTAQASMKGEWNLEIGQDDNRIMRLLVLIRGAAGPGATTSSVDPIDDRLIIDKRWAVSVTPRPASILVGNEEAPWRFSKRTDRSEGTVANGYALLDLARPNRLWHLMIEDLSIVKAKAKSGLQP